MTCHTSRRENFYLLDFDTLIVDEVFIQTNPPPHRWKTCLTTVINSEKPPPRQHSENNTSCHFGFKATSTCVSATFSDGWLYIGAYIQRLDELGKLKDSFPCSTERRECWSRELGKKFHLVSAVVSSQNSLPDLKIVEEWNIFSKTQKKKPPKNIYYHIEPTLLQSAVTIAACWNFLDKCLGWVIILKRFYLFIKSKSLSIHVKIERNQSHSVNLLSALTTCLRLTSVINQSTSPCS